VKQVIMSPGMYWDSVTHISGEICVYRIYTWSNQYCWKVWDCIL